MQGKLIFLENGQIVQKEKQSDTQISRGFVEIKVLASVVTPLDYNLSQNPLGVVGCGRVVRSGGGVAGWHLKNKKVAFYTPQGGAWQEYVIVNTNYVTPLKEDTDWEQASLLYYLPVIAMRCLNLIQKGKHKGVVQTNAWSDFGQIMLRICNFYHIPCINIVNNDAEVEEMKSKYQQPPILNCQDENFEVQLKQLCDLYNTDCGFDWLGGETCGKILNLLPNNSVMYFLGESEEEIKGIHGIQILFSNKKLVGVDAHLWLNQLGKIKRNQVMHQIANLSWIYHIEFKDKMPFESVKQAFEQTQFNQLRGLVLLTTMHQIETEPDQSEAVQIKDQEVDSYKLECVTQQLVDTVEEEIDIPQELSDIRGQYQEGLIHDQILYIGEWKSGKRHGLGILYDKEGFGFKGIFQDGERIYGRLVSRDGEIFQGHWKNNKLEQDGETWTQKYHYRGEYQQGLFHGLGYLEKNNKIYEGQFNAGVKEGQCTYTLANGDVYEGEVHDGKYQGFGKLTTKEFYFEGNWESGQMSGHGIINWSDGRSFEGEFFDTLAGEGTFKLPNGHIVRGEMDNGEILGAVELELGNGVIYKGELDEWEPKSTGELVYPNGSVFNGEIDLDLMGGIGELTLQDGSVVKGRVIRGELEQVDNAQAEKEKVEYNPDVVEDFGAPNMVVDEDLGAQEIVEDEDLGSPDIVEDLGNPDIVEDEDLGSPDFTEA